MINKRRERRERLEYRLLNTFAVFFILLGAALAAIAIKMVNVGDTNHYGIMFIAFICWCVAFCCACCAPIVKPYK